MGTPCRRDCAYYSTYTETCDYTLINYRARPCPAKNCTEYKKREEQRTWQVFTDRLRTHPAQTPYLAGSFAATDKNGDMRSPSEWTYPTADCGHEVYSGERMYANEDGRRLCPNCVNEAFDRLSTAEKAYLLGYELSVAVE